MKLRHDIELNQHFLPDFCSIRALLPLLLFAEVLSILLTLAAQPLNATSLWEGLGLRLLFVSWVVLLSAALLCALKRFLAQLRQWQAGLLAFAVFQTVTVITSYISLTLVQSDVQPIYFYARNLGISSLITVSVLRYLYLQFQSQQQQQASSNAQFAALQARIRPHFLFNSLNTVTSLISIDPDRAEALLVDLSDLFRASLRDAKQWCCLGDELDLVRQYLNIEQMRLDDRLKVSWQIEELPLQSKIPGLLLQPIVENAVYHGIEALAAGGEVVIRGRVRHGQVILTVTNPKPVAQPVKSSGNRIALENIRNRLQHAFGEQGRLMLSTSEGQFQVSLIIPMDQMR